MSRRSARDQAAAPATPTKGPVSRPHGPPPGRGQLLALQVAAGNHAVRGLVSGASAPAALQRLVAPPAIDVAPGHVGAQPGDYADGVEGGEDVETPAAAEELAAAEASSETVPSSPEDGAVEVDAGIPPGRDTAGVPMTQPEAAEAPPADPASAVAAAQAELSSAAESAGQEHVSDDAPAVNERRPSGNTQNEERDAEASNGTAAASEWGAPGSAKRQARIKEARVKAQAGDAFAEGLKASGKDEVMVLSAQKAVVRLLLRRGISQAAKAAGPVGALLGGGTAVVPFFSKLVGSTPLTSHNWYEGQGDELTANRFAATADTLEFLAQGASTIGVACGVASGLGVIIAFVPGGQPIAATLIPAGLKGIAGASAAGLVLGLLQGAATYAANAYRERHILHADLEDVAALLHQQQLLTQGVAAFWGAAGGMSAGAASQGLQQGAGAYRRHKRRTEREGGATATELPGDHSPSQIIDARRKMTEQGRRGIEKIDDVAVGRKKGVEAPARQRHAEATRAEQEAYRAWKMNRDMLRETRERSRRVTGEEASAADLRERAWQNEIEFAKRNEAQTKVRDDAREVQTRARKKVADHREQQGQAETPERAQATAELDRATARLNEASTKLAEIRREWVRSGKELHGMAKDLEQGYRADEALFDAWHRAHLHEQATMLNDAAVTADIQWDLDQRQEFTKHASQGRMWHEELRPAAGVIGSILSAGVGGGRAAQSAAGERHVEEVEVQAGEPPHSSAEVEVLGVAASTAADVAAEASADAAEAAAAEAPLTSAGARLADAEARLAQLRQQAGEIAQRLVQKDTQRAKLEANDAETTRRLSESAGGFGRVDSFVGAVGTLPGSAGRLQHRLFPKKVQDVGRRISEAGATMASRSAASRASFDDELAAAGPRRAALAHQRERLDASRDAMPATQERLDEAERMLTSVRDSASEGAALAGEARAASTALGSQAAAAAQTAAASQASAHDGLEEWAERRGEQRAAARRARVAELEGAGYDVE